VIKSLQSEVVHAWSRKWRPGHRLAVLNQSSEETHCETPWANIHRETHNLLGQPQLAFWTDLHRCKTHPYHNPGLFLVIPG
jgi:hypothetical protein